MCTPERIIPQPSTSFTDPLLGAWVRLLKSTMITSSRGRVVLWFPLTLVTSVVGPRAPIRAHGAGQRIEQLEEASRRLGAHRVQVASEPAKICQASTDFATRLSTK